MDIDDEIIFKVLSVLDKLKENWTAQVQIRDIIIGEIGEAKWETLYNKIESEGLIEAKTYALYKISKKGSLALELYRNRKRNEEIRKIVMWVTLVIAALSAWLSYHYGSKSTDKPLPQKSQPVTVKTMPLKPQSKNTPNTHKTATKKPVQKDTN